MVFADQTSVLQFDLSVVDWTLMAIYFAFVIGIGFILRRVMTSSLDFFLSGRSLPAWITGIGFISANIGAVELLGQSASGAQYGAAMLHYFWIGAIPAMVFLGIVMMPFYYGSKVRSVPEYLRLRFDPKAHLINAVTFVVGSMLIAGVNLYALAIVLEALLGIPLAVAIVMSAVFVLSYILLGGLTSAIYNEVMQFFVVMIGMVPLVVIALKKVGGMGALAENLRASHGNDFVSPWSGTAVGGGNPVGDWVGILLGLTFCLSFGYWTTNFAEVQRAMAAKDQHSARLTPIIGAYPKAIVPLISVLPGMAAVVLLPGIGREGGALEYNQAIPALMSQFLPQGALGIAVTGLLAAFMAGMAANVSSFNAVFTYDLWQDYIRPGRPDRYYLKVGRWATVGGVGIAILTAFIAVNFSNISNYLQTLFSFFNVPLFCAFIIGMFWKRASRSAGFWGILVGTVTAVTVYFLYQADVLRYRSDLQETMWGSIFAFSAGAVAMVVVSLREPRKTDAELHGLVYGMEIHDASDAVRYAWYRSPIVLGVGVLLVNVALYVYVASL
ncbi:MAG TPA: sodium:solute symporter family protein [Dermatophilaceae bacterium]|nr:sodium:solute symporter family protein [Dermatophilaceae bacterium]